jgi:hypothetical protein
LTAVERLATAACPGAFEDARGYVGEREIVGRADLSRMTLGRLGVALRRSGLAPDHLPRALSVGATDEKWHRESNMRRDA